jgi:5-methylcytosine-specific restriction endonuclease McrA
MTWAKHGWASLAALVAFAVLTFMGGAWSPVAWYAVLGLALAMSILYLHYRRRAARVEHVQGVKPVAPGRDRQRMPPKDIEFAVILRDKGICQLNFPGICLVDQQLTVDHIYPWSKGGSSTDMNNLQTACKPCNQRKGATVLA